MKLVGIFEIDLCRLEHSRWKCLTLLATGPAADKRFLDFASLAAG
jgi:hypothetical protein